MKHFPFFPDIPHRIIIANDDVVPQSVSLSMLIWKSGEILFVSAQYVCVHVHGPVFGTHLI